jgi:AraC-like DNA-binding protein
MQQRSQAALFLISPPYDSAEALGSSRNLSPSHRTIPAGSVLVWNMARDEQKEVTLRIVARRPFGLPVVIYLPPTDAWARKGREPFQLIEEARPTRVLTHQPSVILPEVITLVREGPGSLPAEVLDYMAWRGFWIDQETRQIIHRIGELSEDITTLGSVARILYMSRRSLGRRFQIRGLPAPSHWLKIFRVLRASILMQRSGISVHDVARILNYPEAFTLSHQMHRLIGLRPETVRERVGWEWILELWIAHEMKLGGFQHLQTVGDRVLDEVGV